MGNHIKTKLLATSFILLVSINPLQAQQESPAHHLDPGDFALGLRSTWSYFDHDGSGTGVGGQFRLALAPRLNTSWYADYILIPLSDSRQSEYIHIGWSVMYYLLNPENKIHSVQPYVVAGHCFDYNKKWCGSFNIKVFLYTIFTLIRIQIQSLVAMSTVFILHVFRPNKE